jgi:type II secretory pathway component PulF
MVRSGEESGKLDEVFSYLADYLDRSYEVTSKARNALIYPGFVITVFIAVMGYYVYGCYSKNQCDYYRFWSADPALYPNCHCNFKLFCSLRYFVLIGIIIVGFLSLRYIRTQSGKVAFDEFKLAVPYVGTLVSKTLFVSHCRQHEHYAYFRNSDDQSS